MNQGLWPLTNQLYRSLPPSLVPALCFGVAVDCGSGLKEHPSPILGSIPKKCYCGQASAVIEGLTTNTGNTIRDRDARQFPAFPEGKLPDAGNAVRYRDACQATAEAEGFTLDAGDAIRDRDTRQAFAATEGLMPDAGDRFAFNTRRNG